jgi:glycosyltransferase involved in cell wall biosynthesis
MSIVRPRRALWLINHSTLRKFEVPLLESLGYEVYLPKLFPYDEGNLSASIDFSRDATLTIPSEALATLNAHNFYLGMTPAVADICNQYFDVAFLGFFPEQLAGLIRDFKNVVVMRPFGLSNGVTYTNVTAESLGYFFLGELQKAKDRFWFGQAYEHLAEVESGVYRQRALTLPLGLDDARITNEWTGTDPKVLFVCPRIGSSPYFHYIYQNFRKNFGDLPYLVGGAQPIDVADPSVVGHLSRADYDRMMRETRVMYYHSREIRHLHYHPLEAVRIGMPLVFMAGGMLDILGGKQLPGRVSSEEHAHKMLKRILNNDQQLILEIRESQPALLHTITKEYCEPIWRSNFPLIEGSVELAKQSQKTSARRRVAVFLPQAYHGGTLNVVKMLAKMLHKGSREMGQEVDVVFAHLESDIYKKSDFIDLEQQSIQRRTFQWKFINQAQLANVLTLEGIDFKPGGDFYAVPDDGATDFLDCDFWLVGTDRLDHPLAPLRPYCLFVHDYLQRYFPELFGDHYEEPFITTARRAVAVLANTPHTIEDVVHYAGIPRKKAIMAPHIAELDQLRRTLDLLHVKERGEYFQWTTNLGPHKNHVRTLNALTAYYDLGGKLKCHVTGVDTDKLDPKIELPTNQYGTHVTEARKLIARRPELKDNLVFLGNVTTEEYASQLSQACFLLHNVLMDNGTLCAIEAAYAGTPTLSSDYPPMRYLSERYRLNAQFFDAEDEHDLTENLRSMEANWKLRQNSLPDRDYLETLSWQSVSKDFYALIKSFVG